MKHSLVVNPDMEMMQVQSRFNSRLLKGRTRTATFTDDILALDDVSPETLFHITVVNSSQCLCLICNLKILGTTTCLLVHMPPGLLDLGGHFVQFCFNVNK